MTGQSVARSDGELPALHLLWQDEHLLAVYKPAGWLVHRSPLDPHEPRIVLQRLRDQLGGAWLWPLHRLDKGTCGLLLLARHAEAARRLGEAFAAQQVHKRYLAFVRGWAPRLCEVDHALRPDDAPPEAAAQPARTDLHALAWLQRDEVSDARFAATRAALVLAEPHSGRRHQIRRHLKHIAHPIVGDATHGKGALNRWWAERLGLQRLCLHAWTLALHHPMTGAALQLDSGLRLDPGGPVAAAPPQGADWLRLNAAGHWQAPGPWPVGLPLAHDRPICG